MAVRTAVRLSGLLCRHAGLARAWPLAAHSNDGTARQQALLPARHDGPGDGVPAVQGEHHRHRHLGPDVLSNAPPVVQGGQDQQHSRAALARSRAASDHESPRPSPPYTSCSSLTWPARSCRSFTPASPGKGGKRVEATAAATGPVNGAADRRQRTGMGSGSSAAGVAVIASVDRLRCSAALRLRKPDCAHTRDRHANSSMPGRR